MDILIKVDGIRDLEGLFGEQLKKSRGLAGLKLVASDDLDWYGEIVSVDGEPFNELKIETTR